MLLGICVCVSVAFLCVGLWVDPANLSNYAVALVLSPLVIGLVWLYIARFLWDEPINRMLRTINSQLGLPSGQLLECEELLSINTQVQQMLMLLLTNVSVLTATLSRPVLRTALVVSPLAMGALVSFYYTQRVAPVVRANCRLWEYWKLLRVDYKSEAFEKMELKVQAKLCRTESANDGHLREIRALAVVWHARAKLPRAHLLSEAWWAFLLPPEGEAALIAPVAESASVGSGVFSIGLG